MGPLCCGMTAHPYLLYLHHFLNVVACLPPISCSGCFASKLSPKLCPGPLGVLLPLVVPCQRCVHSTNPSNRDKASASVNAVSRDRLVPFDSAAGAVTPTNLLAMAEDFHPMCFLRTSMVVPSIRWLAALPTHKECRVYRLFPILAAQASRSSAPAPAAGSLSSDF